MGEDPEQLEREIEATRAKLGEDIDALEEKINPKKVAHRSVDRAKDKVAEVKDKVAEAAGAAKEKVAGAATDARTRAVEAKDKATDKLSSSDSDAADGSYPTGGSTSSGGVGAKVAGLAGTVKDKAAPLAQKAVPLAQSAKEKAAVRSGLDPQTADNKQVATALAGTTWATLQDQTRRNPAAVGAAAFVLGVLLGR